ncbi:hypothetical protein J2W76_000513 [Methylorubrum zatmanii]|nr:hypothetical protein [Methylorubrum extorquens]MCP1547268.1 hypothetical protein [Methylorubrum zatmanii]
MSTKPAAGQFEGLLQQKAEPRSPGLGQRACKTFECSLAIIDCAVCRVNEAEIRGDVAELASHPFSRPGDLHERAPPRLGRECWTEVLGELPIEIGVVRDHEIGVMHHGSDAGSINHPALDHRSVDPGQPGDFGQDRSKGLLKRAVRRAGCDQASVNSICEW